MLFEKLFNKSRLEDIFLEEFEFILVDSGQLDPEFYLQKKCTKQGDP